MAYIKSLKEQNWLLPPSIQEMIPKDHICFLVEDYVDSLDFSNFDFFREWLRMRDKMEKEESKEVYRLRKCTVEPVIGNIKQNLGFREFLLRGLDKVKIEMNLVGIAHNLQKIWKQRGASKC